MHRPNWHISMLFIVVCRIRQCTELAVMTVPEISIISYLFLNKVLLEELIFSPVITYHSFSHATNNKQNNIYRITAVLKVETLLSYIAASPRSSKLALLFLSGTSKYVEVALTNNFQYLTQYFCGPR